MQKQSQNSRILNYLKKGKSLTPLKAIDLFECTRLAARIQDLEDMGNKIKVRMVQTSTGKRIAEYRL